MPLCAYSCDDETIRGAYAMSRDEILARGQEAADAGCTELHIVGGVHPTKTFDWYLGMIRDLHAAFPRLHLKAWTAVEIDHFAQITKRPVRSILEDLIAAGLGSMPGGGAEIFDPQVRTQICPRKADAADLARHPSHGPRTRAAHQRLDALRPHRERSSIASTISCGCGDLQDETGGFQAFVPLAFHPETHGHVASATRSRRWRICAWWPSAG